MKYIIGIFVTAIVLFASTFFLLRVWGIEMLSPEYTSKLLYSIAIIVVTAIIIVAIILAFSHNTKGYDKNGSGIAQKKL